MPNHKSTLPKFRILLFLISVLFLTLTGRAESPDFYASSSVLSSGNWAKIEVTESGMHFISDATLSTLGFSDGDRVNVFGYGGRMIPENLDSPDDLPLVPSIRVNGGIVFFGHGNVSWREATNSQAFYAHTAHPYSDKAYYFISDCLQERRKPETTDASSLPEGEPITQFQQRLLHETDITPAMNTGRMMLGEDFKSTTSRTFSFSLPGNIGDAIVTTQFACKTSGGTSSIVVSANGKQLDATSADNMAYADSKLIVPTKSLKFVENPGTSLDLNIRFNGAGAVTKAALDYIEVEYPRALSLGNTDLYFYLHPYETSYVKLDNYSDGTIVWDVTDPLNPVEIKGVAKDNTFMFRVEKGYGEFVAFNPSRVSRGVNPAGKVANQDIHSMETPDMVIISPIEYMEAARRLIDLHERTDGLRVVAVTPEEVYNEFSCGNTDVSAFRKMLKMWYDRAEGREGEYTEYCLIMSRPTYDNKLLTAGVRNAGYPRVPIWQSPTGETATTSYSTDDYIGMLEDVRGTFNIGNAEIHTAVGRMPVKSLREANNAITKLEKYLLEPDLGSWRNNVMIIADDQNSGVHLEQAESVIKTMREVNGNDFLFEKLYLDSYPLEYTGTGAAYPAAKERLMNKINEGTVFIDYIGHANPTAWSHEYILTWTDINNMTNTKFPFIYAATCEFMRWDDDALSGAEVLWQYPDAGVIGMICPSREVLISANGVLNQATAQFVFMKDEEGKPLPVGKIMINGKNTSNASTNKLRYGLMGDPSMRLPWPSIKSRVDKINDIDLAYAEEYPTIKARSSVKVEGHIEDVDGTILEDFNGIAEIQLYDAEKPITTYGNGEEGVVSVYNDRKIRLYKGRVKVENGLWSTTINMPSEIENNYSPALLSLYAFDDSGREANGSCESLYVYGYDENVPDDFQGPKMIEFYLNSPTFVNGQEVAPSPVLTARFTDESGISVSEAGIGHGITLQIDGKTFYDDVAQYYMPDENDPTAGSLTYQLTDVGYGKHTLSFTVWDNANNSTTATLDFNISVLWKPSIEVLRTDVNPATTNVNFFVGTDGSTDSMGCFLEVFDINGRRVWSGETPSFKSSSNMVSLGWNLCDYSGGRVRPGIYLYRATVNTENGASVTRSRKLIVAGQ